eukprot:479662-Amphidinium_carterae.1
MSGSSQVGHYVSFQVALKVYKSDASLLHRFTGLVCFNPLEPAVLSEGSPGPLFKVSMPSFGHPSCGHVGWPAGLCPHLCSH